MSKIERLTAEQEQRLVEFRDEYLAHGLSTAPTDKSRAEAAFARAYRVIGKDPVPVIWMSSPMGCCFALSAMKHVALKDVGTNQLGGQLWDQLWGQLWGQLGDQLWDQLRGQLRDQLRDQLWGQLGDQLWDQLRGQLRDQLRDQLWDQLRIEFTNTYWWGQQDLYWIALYKFAAEIGVKYPDDISDRLDIMNEIGMSCMWFYPRDGLIVACERPTQIHRDDRGRLHNVDGSAVTFADGWSVHAVGGVRVPASIIEDKASITPASIEAEPNAEIRRVMIEIFGTERYIREGSAKLIASDPVHGDLYSKDRDDDTPIVMLHVKNNTVEPDGTIREFWLRVHPECRPFRARDGWVGEPQKMTPLNARASTWGLTGGVFQHLAAAA